ncbi:MAG: TonB-dependent receptor [Prevotella sp.]|nr:TonB-dependent receptor [Prevotella sp.]
MRNSDFKKKLLGLLVLFLMVSVQGAWAQWTVKGTVNDEAGEPVIGASVKVVGSSTGSVTDFNGKFSVNASQNGQLEVSYVGYETQRVKIAGRQNIVIVLKEDAQTLNDVVVIGYGTMKKSDISGSVASISAEEMMRRTPTNIAQGLQGAAPGVMVTMQDGAPDANAAVRIRGVATINGNAAPLYVVDGVQVGTNANFLNPSDIESIEILKDASATAIYGAAGANGVVMITTKHGTKGKTNINLTANWGLQTAPGNLDVVSLDGYAKTIRTARANDGTGIWNEVWSEQYDGKRKYIDWLDEMTRTSLKQDYNLSASGGNDKTQYNGSVGYLRNDGVVVNTQYQRITARANVKAQVNDFVEFGADVSFVHSDSHGSNSSVGNFGNLSSYRDYAFACPTMDFVTRGDATYDGIAPGTYVSPNVVNPDGTYGEVLGGKDTNDGFWGTTLGNMYAKQMEKNGRNRTNRALASAYLAITPLKGLTWKTQVAYDYTGSSFNDVSGAISRFNIVDGNYIDVTSGGNAYVNPSNNNAMSLSFSNSDGQTLDIQNTLTYNWSNDNHDLTVMLGNEVSRWYGQRASSSARDFWSIKNRDVSLTKDPSTLGAGGRLDLETRGISYFGRLAYSFLNRYNLTATIRRDGSSNFGSGNRWGTFPSAAASWRVSEEPFMKDVDWISNLKVRLGWGQTGNSGGATDFAVAGLATTNVKYSYYQEGQGIGANNPLIFSTGFYSPLVDTNLKWETNEQLNFGVDFGLLNGDLNVTLDYFIRTSKDLLLNRQIRASQGNTAIYTNYGEIENKGFEFSLAYNKRLNEDWTINATLTGSTLKNKVKKMGEPLFNTNSDSSGQGTGDGSNTGAVGAASGYYWGNHSICKEGEAVGSYYGYRVIGIYTDEAQFSETKTIIDANGKEQTVLKYPRDTDSNGQRQAQVGDYIFEDVDNNGVLDQNDMVILGNGFPTFNFGLNLGATYKNFDISMYMYGELGKDIFSYSAMRLSNMFSSDDGTAPRILQEVADNAWSTSNPTGTFSRLSMQDKNHNMRASDKWVKNGNFLRFANLQVGYTLPKEIAKKAYLQNARVYLSVSNLACISPYNKYGDPEVGQGSVLYTGLDTGRYPMPRTYTLGLNVTF